MPVSLPQDKIVAAAQTAVRENPVNAPPLEMMAVGLVAVPEAAHIAVMTSKYWGVKGRKFGVRFLDNPTAACKSKILSHMNAWSEKCNVSFAESSSGEVRINRGAGGYWSYLGTDILSVGPNEPTMNLQGFTEYTSDAEYRRVVRHETGHTLGCPHEHMRREVIQLLDKEKTIEYFRQTQGWSRQTTIQQVLTPLEAASIMGSPTAEQDSVMCYQIPGVCTITGKPIVGGKDITPNDAAFLAKLYPKAETPPPPPPTGSVSLSVNVQVAAMVAALEQLGFKVTK